jgi:predicted nucleotidyltransferase
MNKEETLLKLRAIKQKIESFGVKSLAIFGSVAREESNESSDLDLLVEFEGKMTFDKYMDLKFYLEDYLDVKVDLVSQKMLKKQILNIVLEEAINVT